MKRFFLSVLLVCVAAPPVRAVCVPNLTLHVRNPEPLYVNGGEQQLWRIAFNNSSVETAYNVTITEQAGSFDQRTYAGPSLSVTLAGAGTATPSWAPDLAGPWTDGEPSYGTGSPLYLRWVVSSLPPGLSGEISYRTLTQAGAESLLETSASATLSCDPMGLAGAALDYSDTSTGERIQPPLMALRIHDGWAMTDYVWATTTDRQGNVLVAGYETGEDGFTDWIVRKYDPTLSTVLSSTTYDGPAHGDDQATAVTTDAAGNVIVAGYEDGTDGTENWRIRKYDATLSVLLGTTDYDGAWGGDDEAWAIAVDPAGNVVVGGNRGWVMCQLVKYDPSLTTILATLDYNFYVPGFINAVAADAGGNIYLAGYTGGSGGWRVEKYDSALTARLGSSVPNSGYACAMAIDRTGDVFVAGVSGGSTQIVRYDGDLHRVLASAGFGAAGNAWGMSLDANGNPVVGGSEPEAVGGVNWVIRKYDNALNVLDARSHDGLVGGADEIWAVAANGSSSAYVAGYETVRDDAEDLAVARYELAEFTPASPPLALTAAGYLSAVGLVWSPAAGGTRPVSGYRIYRQTFQGVTEASWLADATGAAASTYTDTTVTGCLAYYYRVLAVDSLGAESVLSNEAGAVPLAPAFPCLPRVSLRLRNPDPLYAAGGAQQLWRLVAADTGALPVYGVTVNTQDGSFDQRTYVAGSFSTTVYAGGTVVPSWATDPAGPWTDGEPPDGTGAPLYLRWVVSSLPGGWSAEVSYRTTVLPGPEVLLSTYASATHSCDAALVSGASLAYSVTSMGKRLVPPLVWVATVDGPDSSYDNAIGVTVGPTGDIVAVGGVYAGGRSNWIVRQYSSGGMPMWTDIYGSPPYGNDLAIQVAVNAAGRTVVVGQKTDSMFPNYDWLVREYDGTGALQHELTYNKSPIDAATGVVLDRDGNAIVVGYTVPGWMVRKYDTGWNLVWSTTGPPPHAYVGGGVAAFPDGSFAVVGAENRTDLGQGRNWLVVRYAADGSILWSRTYNAPANGDDEAVRVSIDEKGNVLVLGSETRSDAGQGLNWRIIKYDSDGNLVWSRSYNSPANLDDQPGGVAVDAVGNVIIAGTETRTDLGQGLNWRILRYDSAGNLLDSIAHDGFLSGDDGLWGVCAIPGSQDVIVAGSETVPNEARDFTVARITFPPFDPPAAPGAAWTNSYFGSVGLNWLPSVAGTRPVSGYRIFRQTFAGVTEASWVADVTGASAARYVDTNVTGGVTYYYVVVAVDTLGAESAFSYEVTAVPLLAPDCISGFTRKVRPPVPLYVSGGEQQLWRVVSNNASVDTAYNVTVSTEPLSFDQRTYVAPSFSATAYAGATITPSWAPAATGPWTDGEPPNGTGSPLYLRWTLSRLIAGFSAEVSYRTLTSGGPEALLSTCVSATLTCDPGLAGGAEIPFSYTGTGMRIVPPLMKLDVGFGQWDAGKALAVAVDAAGNVIVAGQGQVGPAVGVRVVKYAPGMTTVLASTILTGIGGYNGTRLALAVDGSSNVIVGGCEVGAFPTGLNWSVRKLDPTLTTVLGSATYDSAVNGTDIVLAVAVDAAGNVVVAGQEGTGGPYCGWRVSRYDPALATVLSTTCYGGAWGSFDWPTGMAINGQGDVIVVGTGPSANVRRYSADLARLLSWTGSGANAEAVAVDGNGNVFVAGEVAGVSGLSAWRVAKLDPTLSVVLASTDYQMSAPLPDRVTGIALGSDGSVVVSGYEETSAVMADQWLLRRYDNALNLLDFQTHPGLVAVKSYLYGVAAWGTASVYIAGTERVWQEGDGFAAGWYQFTAFNSPAPPLALTAAGSVGQIGLAWTPAVAGTRTVSGYRIFRQTFAGVTETFRLADVAGAAVSTYADAAVVPGVTYFYRVLAVDWMGAESLLSNEASATPGVPPMPAVLSASIVISSSAVCPGWSFLILVTVTNTGEAPADGVVPASLRAVGAGAATLVSGPMPQAPVTVTGGASVTFTWTCQGTAAGEVEFTTTVTGTDAYSGAPVSTGLVGPAILTVTATGALAATLTVPALVSTGQLVTIEATVTNTGAKNVAGVAPAISVGPGTEVPSLPDPLAWAVLAPGEAKTFRWTCTAQGSGVHTFTLTATGITCSGWIVRALATAEMTVVAPAVLTAWMDAPAVVTTGLAFTATLYVADIGGLSATVTGIARGETVSGIVSAPGVMTPTLPFPVAGLASTGFLWSYTAVTCGPTILTVTVTGAEAGTGRALGPVVVGRWVTVSGTPSVVQITASPATVAAGSAVTLTVTVFDSCSPANTVSGAAVSLFVISGGGHVTPASGVTNVFGRLVATLTTGTTAGVNGVRADVTAGLYPSSTVYVTGTAAPLVAVPPPLLTSPGAATDKNVFSPSRGDVVLARIAPVNDSPIEVRVYTASGRLIRTLRNLVSAGSGQYLVVWNGRTEDEFVVARGVYLIRVLGGGLREVVKVVVK